MKCGKKLSRVLVAWAMISCALPPGARAENMPQQVITAAVQDAALSEGGVLEGRVMDAGGQPVAYAELVVRQGQEVVATELSDGQGRFAFTGLRSGVYEIAAGEVGGVYRLWAPGTAPPSATHHLLVPTSEAVVRGQMGPFHRALILGGIITVSGVIGGVIGYNVRDFDPAS